MGMMGAHTHPKPPKAKPKPRNGKEGDPNHERAPKPVASIRRSIFTGGTRGPFYGL